MWRLVNAVFMGVAKSLPGNAVDDMVVTQSVIDAHFLECCCSLPLALVPGVLRLCGRVFDCRRMSDIDQDTKAPLTTKEGVAAGLFISRHRQALRRGSVRGLPRSGRYRFSQFTVIPFSGGFGSAAFFCASMACCKRCSWSCCVVIRDCLRLGPATGVCAAAMAQSR